MLFTASSNGQISWTDITSDASTTTVIASLGKDLTCARVHPKLGHILAVGGKERELTLYDMKVLSGKADSDDTSTVNSANNTTKYKKQKDSEKGQIFQAKNVCVHLSETYILTICFLTTSCYSRSKMTILICEYQCGSPTFNSLIPRLPE
jgi:hypothetical protein